MVAVMPETKKEFVIHVKCSLVEWDRIACSNIFLSYVCSVILNIGYVWIFYKYHAQRTMTL